MDVGDTKRIHPDRRYYDSFYDTLLLMSFLGFILVYQSAYLTSPPECLKFNIFNPKPSISWFLLLILFTQQSSSYQQMALLHSSRKNSFKTQLQLLASPPVHFAWNIIVFLHISVWLAHFLAYAEIPPLRRGRPWPWYLIQHSLSPLLVILCPSYFIYPGATDIIT